jgi:ATP-dependent RNA helicase DDX19/DBP5
VTDRLNSRINKDAQKLLFSATFPAHVQVFAKKFAPNANEIMLRTEELSVEGIKQFYMDCPNVEAKFQVLVNCYNLMTVGQSIIFVQARIYHIGASQVLMSPVEKGHCG